MSELSLDVSREGSVALLLMLWVRAQEQAERIVKELGVRLSYPTYREGLTELAKGLKT